MSHCVPENCSSAERRGPWLARPAWLMAFALAALVGARTASAHQASISHARATVSDDRTSVDYQLSLEPPDTAEPLDLPADTAPTDEQVRAGAAQLLTYVLARVHLSSDDTPCTIEHGGQSAGQDLGVRVSDPDRGPRLVEIRVRMTCARPIHTLVIDYDLFFDLDPLHRNILAVYYGDERALVELDAEQNRFVWDLAAAPPSGLVGFVKSGVEHIALGYDHIAFLIGLLLVVTIARGAPAQDSARAWHVRDLWSGLRYTAAIVTSFTAAHSLTLIAASLGWISLSSRVVESLIAASIAYVAIENIVRPQANYRWLVTFGFGLMHGMGFASVLEVLLPPEDVIGPLLMFNVGVELGQLAIVVLLLPLLTVFTRAIGARRYRELFLPVASGLLALLGLAWLLERALDTVILGL